MHIGNKKVGEVYLGSTKIGEGWTMIGGVLRQVYSAVPPWTDSQASQRGNASGVRDQWVRVPVTREYGDPMVNYAFIVSSKSVALIRGGFTAPQFTYEMRLMVNGNQVAHVGAASGFSTEWRELTATMLLSPGDEVWLEMKSINLAMLTTLRGLEITAV